MAILDHVYNFFYHIWNQRYEPQNFFRMLLFPSSAFISLLQCLYFVFCHHFFILLKQVENMYQKSWNEVLWIMFKIFPTISGTRDMSPRNFFECCRCLHGRNLSAWPISPLQCLYFVFLSVFFNFIETNRKYVSKIMEWRFMNHV